MPTQDTDIVFLFKILILGFEKGIGHLWETINPESISTDTDMLKGIQFGSKTYYVPLKSQMKKIGTKIFFCSFNPAIVLPVLRKAYLRGANGIVLTFFPTDNKELMIETLYDLLETNKDSLPFISLVISGEKSLYHKNEQFVKAAIHQAASKFALPEIEKVIGYQSTYIPEGSNLSMQIINDLILEQINKLIIKVN